MKKTKYTPQAGDVCEWHGIEVMVCYSFKLWEDDNHLTYALMFDNCKQFTWAISKHLKLIYRP